MSEKPPDPNEQIYRDLILYGNGFLHFAMIDGELKVTRLDPQEVVLKVFP